MKLPQVLLLFGCSGAAIAGQCEQALLAYESCSALEYGVAFERSTDSMCLKGDIDDSMADQFAATVQTVQRMGGRIQYFVVESPGGAITPAMDIAEQIERNGQPVVVGGVCASSCAQFLFVAGRKKYLLDGGVVAFHGGPISPEAIEAMDLPRENIDHLLAENVRFSEFYASRNISMGMLSNPPDHVKDELARGEFVFWTWSVPELAGFGVDQVQECVASTHDQKGD